MLTLEPGEPDNEHEACAAPDPVWVLFPAGGRSRAAAVIDRNRRSLLGQLCNPVRSVMPYSTLAFIALTISVQPPQLS